jgi:citrate lyase gamma subunit
MLDKTERMDNFLNDIVDGQYGEPSITYQDISNFMNEAERELSSGESYLIDELEGLYQELQSAFTEETLKAIEELVKSVEVNSLNPVREATSSIEDRVKGAVKANFKALAQALKARRADQEDMIAHDAVKAAIIKTAKEAGYGDAESTPWMEDEMFSGAYSAKEAIEYLIDSLIETLEDMETPIDESETGTAYPRIDFEKAILAAREAGISKEELHIMINQIY